MTATINHVTQKITYAVVSVDPDMAQRWLKTCNTHNRVLSPIRVSEYTKAMLEHRWKFNGETIQFDRNNVLLNGQHRLHAVVQSGTTQTFLLVRGLDPQVQTTMDQGTRRAPHEQLQVAGIAADQIDAAALRVFLRWQSGRLFGDALRNRVSTGEIVAFAQGNPDIIALLRTLGRGRIRSIPATPSVTVAVALQLHLIDSTAAREFFDLLESGAGLAINSPILTLSRRFVKAKTERAKLSERDVIGFYIIAWNAWRDGRSLTKLQRPNGSAWTGRSFPVPH